MVRQTGLFKLGMAAILREVMLGHLKWCNGYQTFMSEFEFHWVPHLSKLLIEEKLNSDLLNTN